MSSSLILNSDDDFDGNNSSLDVSKVEESIHSIPRLKRMYNSFHWSTHVELVGSFV